MRRMKDEKTIKFYPSSFILYPSSLTMRYLALDVGNKRVGVAVGSGEGKIATPLTVIERSSIEQDAARLLKLIQAYDVEALVVGLPRNTNDMPGEQETRTRAYMKQLEKLVPLPVSFQ